MGVLDDAIREHLELKRKHGVPEEEVERQEEEALGPARRDVAQQPEERNRGDGRRGHGAVRRRPSRHARGSRDRPAVADDRDGAIAEEPPAARATGRSRRGLDGGAAGAERGAAWRPREPTSSQPPPSGEPMAPTRRRPPAARPSRPDPPAEPRSPTHEALGDTEPHGFAGARRGRRGRRPEDHARERRARGRRLRRGRSAAEADDDEPTCSRTRPTSSRRRRSTTGSGSSRSRRATSTSTRLKPREVAAGSRPPRRPPA